MSNIKVGDYVRFRCAVRLGRLEDVYVVIGVSDVYDMVRLRNRESGICISWYPISDVQKVGFYQPELVREGVDMDSLYVVRSSFGGDVLYSTIFKSRSKAFDYAMRCRTRSNSDWKIEVCEMKIASAKVVEMKNKLSDAPRL